jgi:hypothetical protein
MQSIFEKIAFYSKQFIKDFTARIKNLVSRFTINNSAKMYTNCRHFVTIFVIPATTMQKKSLKKRENFPPVHL